MVEEGIDVTLFATGDSFTKGKLESIVNQGYEEDQNAHPKVCECMHISLMMEKAHQFDLIHNHFDFLPLTYSRLIKTWAKSMFTQKIMVKKYATIFRNILEGKLIDEGTAV